MYLCPEMLEGACNFLSPVRLLVPVQDCEVVCKAHLRVMGFLASVSQRPRSVHDTNFSSLRDADDSLYVQ